MSDEKKKVYSHSKLSSFEQCPFKYKCRYIDKIKPDFEKSVESLLGTCVHETLEWVYDLAMKKLPVPTIDGVVDYYSAQWEKNFSKDIHVVSKTLSVNDYFNRGVQFLIGYYLKHTPFSDGTMNLEMEIKIDLDKTGKYNMIGYIDRLAFNEKTQEYEVHDYKTGSLPQDKNKFVDDRQLGLYSIAIRELFGTEKKVCLVWHYLAHDQKICSYRTDEQLEILKKKIIALIDKIESTQEFPPNPSILCDWCEYKSNCPIFNAKSGQSKDKQKKLSF